VINGSAVRQRAKILFQKEYIMRRFFFQFMVVLCAAFLMVGVAAAQQSEQAPSEEDIQKMMEAYEKLGAPGPEHEKLACLAGEWITHTKIWTSPDATPIDSPPGIHKGEMIFDGRFILFTQTGEMMDMQMEGMGVLGFDKFRQVYQMFWIDNSATPIYIANGTADTTGNVITLLGKVDDMLTGERDKDVKWIYRFESDDEFIFEMWDTTGDGEFYKSFEITYTKK
jgi:hypothetical protein